MVGFSLGGAELREGETLDGLLRRVDAALYASKAGGRGRVTGDGLDSLVLRCRRARRRNATRRLGPVGVCNYSQCSTHRNGHTVKHKAILAFAAALHSLLCTACTPPNFVPADWTAQTDGVKASDALRDN